MSGFDPTLVLLVLVVGIGAILLLCVLMLVMPPLFRAKSPSKASKATPVRLRPDRFGEGYRAGWKARDDVAASEATRFSSLLDAPIQPYDGS